MKALLGVFFSFSIVLNSFGQVDPWKKEQVMPTAVLAAKIQSEKNLPLILNVGPMGNIKTAVKVGAVNSDEGIQKLKTTVAGMDKNRETVVYCGCCSYSNCPNLRPAFEELARLGFKNVKVLNIPEGIVPDWSGKGYPME
jgi:thiosulfate/3-mercaptopyruvate sulfurtransferase